VARRSEYWAVAVIAASFCAGMVTAASPLPPIRVAVVLPFLLVCPGMAVVLRLRLAEWWTELLLAVGVSIALDIVLSSAMLYAGLWSPSLLLLGLAGLGVAGGTYELLQAAPGRA
jgi:hypothetical protein